MSCCLKTTPKKTIVLTPQGAITPLTPLTPEEKTPLTPEEKTPLTP